MKKKIVSALLACSMLLSLGAAPAFAATPAAAVKAAVCPVSGCSQTGTHNHGDAAYKGHKAGDGHSWHQNCGVSGCDKTENHSHGSESGSRSSHGKTHRSGSHGENGGGRHH